MVIEIADMENIRRICESLRTVTKQIKIVDDKFVFIRMPDGRDYEAQVNRTVKKVFD